MNEHDLIERLVAANALPTGALVRAPQPCGGLRRPSSGRLVTISSGSNSVRLAPPNSSYSNRRPKRRRFVLQGSGRGRARTVDLSMADVDAGEERPRESPAVHR
jgi:hypothetical protein